LHNKVHPAKTKVGKVLAHCTFLFPTAMEAGIGTAFKSKTDLSLQHAIGYLYNGSWNRVPIAMVGIPINTTSRIFGVTWKKKWGIELDRSSYLIPIDLGGYNRQLQVVMPDYFTAGIHPYDFSGNSYGDIQSITNYGGWTLGVSYSRIKRQFLLQGKLLAGLSNNASGINTSSINASYAYKQYGSNHVLTSNINVTPANTSKLMYAGQVIVAWLPNESKSGFWHLSQELGARLELAFVPFSSRVVVTDIDWNQQATVVTTTTVSTRTLVSISVYCSIRLTR